MIRHHAVKQVLLRLHGHRSLPPPFAALPGIPAPASALLVPPVISSARALLPAMPAAALPPAAAEVPSVLAVPLDPMAGCCAGPLFVLSAAAALLAASAAEACAAAALPPAGRHMRNTGKPPCQVSMSQKPWRRYSRRLRSLLACSMIIVHMSASERSCRARSRCCGSHSAAMQAAIACVHSATPGPATELLCLRLGI